MVPLEWFRSKNFNPVNYCVSAMLLYLRAMYTANGSLGYEVYDDKDPNQSDSLAKLVITDQNTWDTQHRGHLPSIVLQREMISFGGGIQDGGRSRVKQAGNQLETSVMEIVTVPVVLSCIARQDLEAEALALLTTQFLWDDHRWSHAFKLFGIVSPQITKVIPYNQSDNSFKCDIVTAISCARNYTTRLLPETTLTNLSVYLDNELKATIQA